jgi:hypothetical protein
MNPWGPKKRANSRTKNKHIKTQQEQNQGSKKNVCKSLGQPLENNPVVREDKKRKHFGKKVDH